jgi:hypothetical protein
VVQGTIAAQSQGAYHAIDLLAGRAYGSVKRLVVMVLRSKHWYASNISRNTGKA